MLGCIHLSLCLCCLSLRLCRLSLSLMYLLCNIYINVWPSLSKNVLVLALIAIFIFQLIVVLHLDTLCVKFVSTKLVLGILLSAKIILLSIKLNLKNYLLIDCLEFVVSSLIDHLLASDSVELIIVTVYNQLSNIQQFKLVVVSLHNQNIKPTV